VLGRGPEPHGHGEASQTGADFIIRGRNPNGGGVDIFWLRACAARTHSSHPRRKDWMVQACAQTWSFKRDEDDTREASGEDLAAYKAESDKRRRTGAGPSCEWRWAFAEWFRDAEEGERFALTLRGRERGAARRQREAGDHRLPQAPGGKPRVRVVRYARAAGVGKAFAIMPSTRSMPISVVRCHGRWTTRYGRRQTGRRTIRLHLPSVRCTTGRAATTHRTVMLYSARPSNQLWDRI